MTDQQLHHIFNHIPAIGQAIGFAVLIIALIMRKQAIMQTGAWIILVSAIAVFPANQTGEGAEEKIEHLAGVSEQQIHEHEEAAEQALSFTIVAGALASLYIIIAWRKWRFANVAAALTIVASCFAIYFLYEASHQGGLIRHPELGNATQTTAPNETGAGGEDDDD